MAGPARAQSGTTAGPVRAVIEAEFAFAADGLQRGIKPAFLAVMDDSAIIFHDAVPALARPYWLTKSAPTPADPKLRWAPALAGTAKAGDLGYTTGPWLLTDAGSGATIGTGQFFTIWERQPNGTYHWLLDNGISSPLAAAPGALPTPATVELGPVGRRTPGYRKGHPPKVLSNARLLDDELQRASTLRSRRVATMTRLHPRARLLREGLAPLTAPGALEKQLDTEESWRLLPAGGRVAASGELAYTYGRYQLKNAAGGSYAHLWLHSENGWQLLLEITNPAPEAKK